MVDQSKSSLYFLVIDNSFKTARILLIHNVIRLAIMKKCEMWSYAIHSQNLRSFKPDILSKRFLVVNLKLTAKKFRHIDQFSITEIVLVETWVNETVTTYKAWVENIVSLLKTVLMEKMYILSYICTLLLSMLMQVPVSLILIDFRMIWLFSYSNI